MGCSTFISWSWEKDLYFLERMKTKINKEKTLEDMEHIAESKRINLMHLKKQEKKRKISKASRNRLREAIKELEEHIRESAQKIEKIRNLSNEEWMKEEIERIDRQIIRVKKIIKNEEMKKQCGICSESYEICEECEECEKKSPEQLNKETQDYEQKIKELELFLKSAKGIRKLHATREIYEYKIKIQLIRKLLGGKGSRNLSFLRKDSVFPPSLMNYYRCLICGKKIYYSERWGEFIPLIGIEISGLCDDCENKTIEQLNNDIQYQEQKIKELESELKTAKPRLKRRVYIKREISTLKFKIEIIKHEKQRKSYY